MQNGGYQVIAVDSRGHGRSTYDPNQALGYDLMADDIFQILYKHGIEKVNVVGWSDGGVITVNLCITYADYINKAVLIGTNVEFSENSYQPWLYQQLDDPDLKPDFDAEAGLYRPIWATLKWQQWWLVSGYDYWNNLFPEFRDKLYALWKTPCYIPKKPYRTCVGSLDAMETSTLIIYGLNEETILPEHCVAMNNAMPNSTIVPIYGAGHMVPLQKSKVVNNLILSFFDSP